MKRVTLAALAGFLAAFFSVDALDAQGMEVGVVREASGDAFIVRAGDPIPAGEGDPVWQDDVLRTGAESSIGIVLRDTTRISLGANSQFHLEEFRFAPLRNDFSLIGRIIEGSMVFITGDIGRLDPESIRLETPIGIIGIRGTRVAIAADNAADIAN